MDLESIPPLFDSIYARSVQHGAAQAIVGGLKDTENSNSPIPAKFLNILLAIYCSVERYLGFERCFKTTEGYEENYEQCKGTFCGFARFEELKKPNGSKWWMPEYKYHYAITWKCAFPPKKCVSWRTGDKEVDRSAQPQVDGTYCHPSKTAELRRLLQKYSWKKTLACMKQTPPEIMPSAVQSSEKRNARQKMTDSIIKYLRELRPDFEPKPYLNDKGLFTYGKLAGIFSQMPPATVVGLASMQSLSGFGLATISQSSHASRSGLTPAKTSKKAAVTVKSKVTAKALLASKIGEHRTDERNHRSRVPVTVGRGKQQSDERAIGGASVARRSAQLPFAAFNHVASSSLLPIEAVSHSSHASTSRKLRFGLAKAKTSKKTAVTGKSEVKAKALLTSKTGEHRTDERNHRSRVHVTVVRAKQQSDERAIGGAPVARRSAQLQSAAFNLVASTKRDSATDLDATSSLLPMNPTPVERKRNGDPQIKKCAVDSVGELQPMAHCSEARIGNTEASDGKMVSPMRRVVKGSRHLRAPVTVNRGKPQPFIRAIVAPVVARRRAQLSFDAFNDVTYIKRESETASDATGVRLPVAVLSDSTERKSNNDVFPDLIVPPLIGAALIGKMPRSDYRPKLSVFCAPHFGTKCRKRKKRGRRSPEALERKRRRRNEGLRTKKQAKKDAKQAKKDAKQAKNN